jgi:hypothetical protein
MAPSQTVASDGVEHRGAEKCKADDNEENVKHGEISE